MLLAKQQQSVTSSKTAAERVALGRQVHGVFVQLDLTRGVGHRDLPGGVNGRVGVATLHATLDLPWAQCKGLWQHCALQSPCAWYHSLCQFSW